MRQVKLWIGCLIVWKNKIGKAIIDTRQWIAQIRRVDSIDWYLARVLPYSFLEHFFSFAVIAGIWGLAMAATSSFGGVGIALVCFTPYFLASLLLYWEVVVSRRWVEPWQYILCYALLYGTVPGTFLLAVMIGILWFYVRINCRLWMKHRNQFFAPYGIVRRKYHGLAPRSEMSLWWGGLRIPLEYAVQNFMLIGSIGSGKTILLRLFLQTFIPYIGQGQGYRAIVYDAATNMVPILKGINKDCNIVILNPFDSRHTAWDISRDIRDQADCRMLAEVLAPEAPGGERDPVWRNATILILEGLALYFTLNAGNRWTLRDILVAARSKRTLAKILKSDSRTVHYAEDLEAEDRMNASIIKTVQIYLSQFSTIAALWEQASRRFSLQEWENTGDSVLLLGHNEKYLFVLSAINRLILKLTSSIIANRDTELKPKANTFIVIDEFVRLGYIQDFHGFVATIRAKGVSTAIAFQSYADMQNVYGDEKSETIVGQFTYKSFLRLNDVTTAEWGSRYFGKGVKPFVTDEKFLGFIPKFDRRNPTSPANIIESYELMQLPLPKENQQGVKGAFMSDRNNYWYYCPSWYIKNNLESRSKISRFYSSYLPNQLLLKSWNIADLRRLNLENIIDIDEHEQQETQTIQNTPQEDIKNILENLSNLEEHFKQVDIYEGEDKHATLQRDIVNLRKYLSKMEEDAGEVHLAESEIPNADSQVSKGYSQT